MERPDLALRLELLQEALKIGADGDGPPTVPVVSSGARDSCGRFASELSFHALLDRVGLVAGAAAAVAGEGVSPLQVSKAAFDAAREREAEIACPSAEAVRKRLGVPWRLVLELALVDRRRRAHLLSLQGDRRRAQFAGGQKEIVRALRAVALAHGSSPNQRDYDLVSLQLQAQRARKGRAELQLPHSATIIARFGSWNRALEAAGLDPLPPHAPPRPAKAQPALPHLDRCISETGLLPSSRWFVRWCRANGIPVSERAIQPWHETMAAVRGLRGDRGEETPAHPPAKPTDYPPLPNQAAGGGRRGHSREAVLASLTLYGERHLPAGARPRYKHYQAAAAADSQLLAASVLGRHGRFQDLCAEVGL